MLMYADAGAELLRTERALELLETRLQRLVRALRRRLHDVGIRCVTQLAASRPVVVVAPVIVVVGIAQHNDGVIASLGTGVSFG